MGVLGGIPRLSPSWGHPTPAPDTATDQGHPSLPALQPHGGDSAVPSKLGPNGDPPPHSPPSLGDAKQSCHGNRLGRCGSSCGLKVGREKIGGGGTHVGGKLGSTPPKRGTPDPSVGQLLPIPPHQLLRTGWTPTHFFGGPAVPGRGELVEQHPWEHERPQPHAGTPPSSAQLGTGMSPQLFWWGRPQQVLGGLPLQPSPALPGSSAMATWPDPRHVPGVTVTAPAAASLIPAWKSALRSAGGRGRPGGGPAAAPAAPAWP